ncbi:MAG: hypothetical protein JWP81_3396 [Ferruginibacter sp.]|nr:hypothetical protein [Ferruginibacter sp.]
MKKLKFLSFIAAVCISQACNDSNKDSVTEAKDSNHNALDSSAMVNRTDTAMRVNTTPVDKDATDFAVEAANGGMMEVDLGKYAQQNAMSDRVKNFGAMMVRDHSAANEELKTLSSSKNIALPMEVGSDAKKHMDDLMKKKGKDFDKAYMDMMLDDHKKDVKAFQKAANECKDADLKSFAGKTLPTLQTHLDSAKAITGKK